MSNAELIAALRGNKPAASPNGGLATSQPFTHPAPHTETQVDTSPASPEGSGIGELPPAAILSAEAWALLWEKDPLDLNTKDIDDAIAYARNHRKMLADGIIKKGQKKPPAPKKTPTTRKKKTEKEADPVLAEE